MKTKINAFPYIFAKDTAVHVTYNGVKRFMINSIRQCEINNVTCACMQEESKV